MEEANDGCDSKCYRGGDQNGGRDAGRCGRRGWRGRHRCHRWETVDKIRKVATGIKNGMDSGSHSTPAAVLTLAAVGSAGLVEWPVLLGVGGTALVLRRLNDRQPASSALRLATVPDDGTARSSAGSTRPRKVARPAKKTTKATKPAKATKSASAGTRRRTSSATRRNPAKR